jgi:preprotein translocase subunit SecG
MTFFLYLTIVLFIAISVILILLVLIQKGRGGGLSGAFGGGGGNTAFGSKTGDVLTWATSIVFGVFLLLGIMLNILANKYNERMAGASGQTSSNNTGNNTNNNNAPAGSKSSLPQPLPAEPGLPAPTPTK